MRPDGRKLTLSGIGYAPYTHAQAWAIVLICCEVLLEPGCDEWQWFHAFFCFGPFRNDCFKKVFVCRKRERGSQKAAPERCLPSSPLQIPQRGQCMQCSAARKDILIEYNLRIVHRFAIV